MRVAFTNTLYSAAKKNKDVMLLTADLGYSIFEPFMRDLPRQYLNVGVSEQNMTGIAAGMAIEGKIPVIYSIIPFVTMRNFEQIRNDICYQNLNVKIVGVGSGFSYGPYGHTHHGLEDMGILRTLPNLVILSPSDPREAEEATKWALRHMGPVYIRLGKAGEPVLNKEPYVFRLGKGNILKKGSDVAIFSTGAITDQAMKASLVLKSKGIDAGVVSMTTIKPLDEALILRESKEVKAIVTLEEHSVIGGLGSAVAEVLAENSSTVRFKRIGVPDRFTKKMGRQEFMRVENGLSVTKIADTISDIVLRK